MAKSKRKRALEQRNKREASQLLKYVVIGGLVLVFLMYLLFRSMN